MPLVVPGVTNAPDSQTEEWSNKLVGKKITDDETSNEVVSPLPDTHLTRVPKIEMLTDPRSHRTLQSVTFPRSTGLSRQAQW